MAPSRWYEILPQLLLSGATLGLCMLPWTVTGGATNPELLSFLEHLQLSVAGVRLTNDGTPFALRAVETDPGMLCMLGTAVTMGLCLLEAARGLVWLPRPARAWIPVPSALLAAAGVAWMMTEPRGSLRGLLLDRTDWFYAAVVAGAGAAIFALARALGVGRRRPAVPDQSSSGPPT